MFTIAFDNPTVEAGKELRGNLVISARKPMVLKRLEIHAESDQFGGVKYPTEIMKIDGSSIPEGQYAIPFVYSIPANVPQSRPIPVVGLPDVRVNYRLHIRVVKKGIMFSSKIETWSPFTVYKDNNATVVEAAVRATNTSVVVPDLESMYRKPRDPYFNPFPHLQTSVVVHNGF